MPYKEAYMYNPFGHRIEMAVEEGPDKRRVIYSYDAQGRLAEQDLYSLSFGDERSLNSRILYKYHSTGALKREMWYRGNNLLVDDLNYSNYEYDSRGNWIIRKQVRHQYYDKNMPTLQTYWAYREISYFLRK